jgi:hypothetical protein
MPPRPRPRNPTPRGRHPPRKAGPRGGANGGRTLGAGWAVCAGWTQPARGPVGGTRGPVGGARGPYPGVPLGVAAAAGLGVGFAFGVASGA